MKVSLLYLLYIIAGILPVAASTTFPVVRTSYQDRNFVSPPIEREIQQMYHVIKDPELAWMFENCFPNTLDRTVTFTVKNGKPNTFVITGDIHAMWLRDCSAQVWPYLNYSNEDEHLQALLAGVINRLVESVMLDPYANAFNFSDEGGKWMSDNTQMRPELHERKWEVDGLCYVIRLSHGYWKQTGDCSVFDLDWQKAMRQIVKTFREQQRKTSKGPYRFTRSTEKATDTQFGEGYGNPVRPTGMICSMFRPSDDATIFPYLIPSNAFAVVSLRQLAEIQLNILGDEKFAEECRMLANEIEAAIYKYAVVKHPKYGKIFAYEVDGYGNYLMMDDANIPSLLSLPYLEFVTAKDKIYSNTRKFIWSLDNPYFFKGKVAEGIGGPHKGENLIWPMSILMKALTSEDKDEIAACLRQLKHTHAGTGFMHESFHKDDPHWFSRSWFAWANSLYGELMLKINKEQPDLLMQLY